MPWRGPQYAGEVPTLGRVVLRWITDHLVVPDGPAAGEPLVLTDEQAQFVLDFYRIDAGFEGSPVRGRSLLNARRIRRAMLSRPKGHGKSPLLAALCLAEALAPVVPDGWDAAGEPVGREWTSMGFKAKVQIVAVSEDQTANTWDPLLDMARNGRVFDAYDIEPLDSFVNVPRGRIEYTTSAAISREGYRPVFAVFDQTESWTRTNGGVKLAATVRRNLTKVNGASVETPNAFVPGEGSVAEATWEAWKQQEQGVLQGADGILVDHREAPAAVDVTDRESLLAGLRYAYGASADSAGGWVSMNRVLEDFWDPDTAPQDARRYFLNQITHAVDSWVSQPEWMARQLSDVTVEDGERITLGFDGSRHRDRGVTDATALIGCRVRDGHVFEVAVWEQPDGPAGRDWWVPTAEVDAAVRSAFRRWRVIGFYADPAADWRSHVANWEAAYGRRLRVKSSQQHPIEWWMNRSHLVVRALEQFHAAIVNEELTHDGSYALTRHVLNARRRPSRAGLQIAKENPESPRKIDAAIAATLAWQARLDAMGKGLHKSGGKGRVVVMG